MILFLLGQGGNFHLLQAKKSRPPLVTSPPQDAALLKRPLRPFLPFARLGGLKARWAGPTQWPRPSLWLRPTTSPLRPSALGAGMRQPRDLTSGRGSPELTARTPARRLSPQLDLGATAEGRGVRIVAGGWRPFRSADRPPPLPAYPRHRPLFSLCPASSRRRRGRRGGERGHPCARLSQGLAAAPPSPHPELQRAAAAAAAAPRIRATRGRRRPPRAMGLG